MKPENLKIVFFGTPEFAVPSLQAIVDAGYDVKAVVTAPDKPAGRGMQMRAPEVKIAAEANNIPVLQPVSLKDPEFISTLRAIGADLFVIIAFRMLPEIVWNMPPLGTFNLHASLLPDYRGAAPINWAVINGDTVSGVSTFFLKHEIDTGDILLQEKVKILPEDNVGSLYDKLMAVGAGLTLRTLSDICEGNVKPVPQDTLVKISEPRPAPKITKDTAKINWEDSAVNIHNLVRGMSPYPAAWSELRSETTPPRTVKIFSTAITDRNSTAAPGKVEIESGRMYAATGNGTIEILELQLQGKKRMKVADFLLGAKLTDPYFD